MKSPCYDEVKRVDCPRRKGGCSVDCPEWAEYIEERNKVYELRKIMAASRPDDMPGRQKRIARAIRHPIEYRRFGKR